MKVRVTREALVFFSYFVCQKNASFHVDFEFVYFVCLPQSVLYHLQFYVWYNFMSEPFLSVLTIFFNLLN